MYVSSKYLKTSAVVAAIVVSSVSVQAFANNGDYHSVSDNSAGDSSINNNISTYISSDSFSNILPIKQLIEDDWQQAPAKNASIGFTQNEIGVKAVWHNITFNPAQRLDYFIDTNADTTQAFYLEQTDQALTTKESYQLSLKLHHQRSKGVRLGYQWQLENVSTEISIGYWDVSATRESNVNGELLGNDNGKITGTILLDEFYSDKNFLKRGNFDRWDINGYGLTVDFAANWQVNEQLVVALNIKDLYSDFTMKNLGYSEGLIDTEGTFINVLGGKSYLPLYSGRETSDDYHFKLPEHVNIIAKHQADALMTESFNVNYLARYKRQGDVSFYYAGAEFVFDNSSLQLMLDLENLSPEIRYQHPWFNLVLATDALSIDDAMQFSLAMSVNYHF